jgi:PAS domain S-box-containing protein
MYIRIKQWLEPPYFADDQEKTTQARIMNTLGLYFALALIVAAIVLVPLVSRHPKESWVCILLLLILYLMTRRIMLGGRVTYAALLMTGSAWLVFAGMAMIGGGVASPLMFAIAATTIVAGLLCGAQAGMIFLCASLILGAGFAFLQQGGVGLPQFFVFSPIASGFIYALALLFMQSLMSVIMRNLQDALLHERQQSEARRQAEATLRESEQRLRTIIEHTQAGYFFIDRHGLWQAVNGAWLRMHGYSTADEVIGKPFTLTQVEADAPGAQANLEMLFRGETIPSAEFSRRRKDGSVAYHTFSAHPVLKNGTVIGAEGFIIDATERRQAEQKIRQQIAELQQWYNVTIDRESRTLQLKAEVNDLLRRLNEPIRYPSAD